MKREVAMQAQETASATGSVSKRVGDVVGALVGLVLASPILAACAVGIRFSSGKPILFQQIRPGLYGEPFTLLKFRTMRAEPDGESRNSDESRITAFGGFLRRWSLDELPALWTVLIGDMSLVGPRPLLVQYLERYTPEQKRRQNVKPGITGLAQVSGRNALSWQDRLALDVWYVDNWSPWLDMKILTKTVGQVLTRQGINAPGHATMPEFTGVDDE